MNCSTPLDPTEVRCKVKIVTLLTRMLKTDQGLVVVYGSYGENVFPRVRGGFSCSFQTLTKERRLESMEDFRILEST